MAKKMSMCANSKWRSGPSAPCQPERGQQLNLRFTQRSLLSIQSEVVVENGFIRHASSVSMSLPTVLLSLSHIITLHAFILASTLLAPALCPIASPDDTSSFNQFGFHVSALCSFLSLSSHSMHSSRHRCRGWHLPLSKSESTDGKSWHAPRSHSPSNCERAR
jgi:hypothetical protein